MNPVQTFVKKEKKPIEAASKLEEHVTPDVMNKLLKMKQDLLTNKSDAK